MDNKIILSSLSMDLKRVALGVHRKSYSMADRFYSEALKRVAEVQTEKLPQYMNSIISKIQTLGKKSDMQKSEDALLYSIRIQNFVLYKI